MLSLKFSRMPFTTFASCAITGRNPNWLDNLCPTKICGRLSHWLKLTKESSRVQPCFWERSIGSFPQQWLVIEPNGVLEGTDYILWVLTTCLLSFSVVICYSSIEIGLYSLYGNKVIAAYKLNKKITSQYSFPRKKHVLMTQNSCTVGMRNAILRNKLKGSYRIDV